MKGHARPRFGWLGVLALVVSLLVGVPASADIPDEFTNLKVLPKDIDKRELVSTMRSWSMALGVRCDHCHAEKKGDPEGELDFASDELEPKKVARAMVKMAGEINGTLLPATGRTMLMRVTCVTCHRGLQRPETLEQVLNSVVDIQGVSAAVDRYRKLRGEYYGSGSYDFGPMTLDSVAENLARNENDADGAITLVKLNLEFNPDSAQSHLLLAQLYTEKGDKAAAIASVETALKLDPDNRWAKRMLEQLKSTD